MKRESSRRAAEYRGGSRREYGSKKELREGIITQSRGAHGEASLGLRFKKGVEGGNHHAEPRST